jgi:hypothetical protein
MAGAAAFGNVVVMWIILSQSRMRTVTNYFIGEKRPPPPPPIFFN